MTRILRFALPLTLLACAGSTNDDDTGAAVEACELADDHQTCPACSDGPSTCTFEDT